MRNQCAFWTSILVLGKSLGTSILVLGLQRVKDTVFSPSVTPISGNTADFPTSDAAASDAQISRVCVSCHGKAHDSDADAAFLP